MRVFGNEFLSKDVLQIKDKDKEHIPQGPNSNLFKFEKVLCHSCNTAKSQCFDLAYDQFIKEVEINRDYIIENKEIDFSQIFPENTLEQKSNVLRYYVKHICCRLATNNISIDPMVIDFLNGNKKLVYLYIKFEIRMDLVAWIERLRLKSQHDLGNLYIGSLFCHPNADNKGISMAHSFYTYRWFRMIYFYSEDFNELNYPGYDAYNESTKTTVDSLYLLHPSKYDTLTDDEILDELKNSKDGCKDSEIAECYLKSNPFQALK